MLKVALIFEQPTSISASVKLKHKIQVFFLQTVKVTSSIKIPNLPLNAPTTNYPGGIDYT
jgi:hypothetical protein